MAVRTILFYPWIGDRFTLIPIWRLGPTKLLCHASEPNCFPLTTRFNNLRCNASTCLTSYTLYFISWFRNFSLYLSSEPLQYIHIKVQIGSNCSLNSWYEGYIAEQPRINVLSFSLRKLWTKNLINLQLTSMSVCSYFTNSSQPLSYRKIICKVNLSETSPRPKCYFQYAVLKYGAQSDGSYWISFSLRLWMSAVKNFCFKHVLIICSFALQVI